MTPVEAHEETSRSPEVFAVDHFQNTEIGGDSSQVEQGRGKTLCQCY